MELYLQGRLEGPALMEFENELSSNNELAQELEFQKLVNQIVITGYNEDLRKKIKGDLQALDNKSWFKYRWLALIAIVLLVPIVYYSFLKNDLKNTYQEKILLKDATVSQNPGKTEEIGLSKGHITKELVVNKPNQPDTTINRDFVKIELKESKDSTPLAISTIKEEAIKAISKSAISPIDPCEDVSLKWETEITPTCEGKLEGAIKINQSSILGGTAPFKTVINNISTTYLRFLSEGSYEIKVSDAAGCVSKKLIYLERKTCKKRSFVFAPDRGETWYFESVENEPYSLLIFNQAGIQVFSLHNYSGNFEWNGNNTYGEILNTGIYLFVADYNNGKKETGQVTIVR